MTAGAVAAADSGLLASSSAGLAASDVSAGFSSAGFSAAGSSALASVASSSGFSSVFSTFSAAFSAAFSRAGDLRPYSELAMHSYNDKPRSTYPNGIPQLGEGVGLLRLLTLAI